MSNYSGVIETVLDAGKILKKNFGKLPEISNKGHGASDAVTKLDGEIEEFLYKKLRKLNPTIGFKGEESGFIKKAKIFWLVDPIDGTSHFIRGNPLCTTMLALIEKKKVIFSVIYNFVTGELFIAEKNRGSKLNGKPIHVNSRSLKESYISIESRLKNSHDIKIFLALKEISANFHTITCGYEYGLIASGRLEGRICLDPYGGDYDYAPGSLLVSEAGGVVANIGSQSYDYRNYDFIASNKVIFKELTSGKNALFRIRSKK